MTPFESSSQQHTMIRLLFVLAVIGLIAADHYGVAYSKDPIADGQKAIEDYKVIRKERDARYEQAVAEAK